MYIRNDILWMFKAPPGAPIDVDSEAAEPAAEAPSEG